jgi:antitoxin ParD1/3/4
MPSSYAIGDHFEGLIKRQVESGRYSSASEVVREALRLFEEKEELHVIRLEAMRQQIADGVNSGHGKLAADIFSRLEKKYSSMLETR